MRVTKKMLECKLNDINYMLDDLGAEYRLWHDGGAYGQGPRLYFHKPETPYDAERAVGPRQRIGLCWTWLDAYGHGLWAAVQAQRERKSDPPEFGTPASRTTALIKRLRQVLDMDAETYVESTRPTVELEEVPWTRPPNAKAARLNAIALIARELCASLEEVSISNPTV